MATNKNASIRYMALDKCFANPYKKYFIDDLIKRCTEVISDHYGARITVSRRQILDDINFMRSNAGFEAPIESLREGKRVYYRYEDINFSIQNKPLTETEEIQLKETLEMLNRIKGIAGMKWIESMQTKLFAGIDSNHNKRKIISFEENEYLEGIEHLSPLYQFIINRQCLLIFYKSFKSQVKSRFVISPYYLKQYNNRWFLFGQNHGLNTLQNLALDRIINLKPLRESYIETTFDFENYFEDIVGVTNNELQKVEKIVIELSQNIIPYILSKPIHGSQILKGNILKLEIKPNYEFESLILSFGENMKVILPKSLQIRVAERIKKVNIFYECTSSAQLD